MSSTYVEKEKRVNRHEWRREIAHFERTQSVQVFNTIKRRRSIGHVSQEQPSQEEIERLLEAATYAPSHHVTEPWRFFVLTGSARLALGDVMAASLQARLEQNGGEHIQQKLIRERAKPLRAPVIIVVAITGVRQLHGSPIECVEAASAAVQNMLLTGEEMGLATVWRTGDHAYDPLVKRWFGLQQDDLIVGFIYVGYPLITRPLRIPTHFSVKTIWLS
jgi:nitroreductase